MIWTRLIRGAPARGAPTPGVSIHPPHPAPPRIPARWRPEASRVVRQFPTGRKLTRNIFPNFLPVGNSGRVESWEGGRRAVFGFAASCRQFRGMLEGRGVGGGGIGAGISAKVGN